MLSPPLCRAPKDWILDSSQCLYEWQTLLGTFAAVAVGVTTVWYLRRQIRQAEETSSTLRKAKLQVARAKLPMASSATAAHAKRCIEALDIIEPSITAHARVAPPIAMAPFPDAAEETFDAFLAATDDENGLFSVAAIYAEQQVLAARMEDMHLNPSEHSLAIDYYYLQPIVMHALAMNLLAYGRREAAIVSKIGWDDIKSSARSLLRIAGPRERILKMIDDKAGRSIALPLALSKME